MNVDLISTIVFVVLMIIFLVYKRKKLALQKILFPFLYLILYRSNFGLKFMRKIAKKYRQIVILFGYCSIGLGFLGMIYASYSIVYMIIKFLLAPKVTDTGAALLLPGTNIPGLGYISFWHWIIAIFILAIVHEFSHGIVAEAHGLKIKNSGFAFMSLLVPIIPAAFVEPNNKKLSKKPDFVQYSILAAGPISNILLAVFLAFVMSLVIAPIGNSISTPLGFSFDVNNESLPAGVAGLESGMIIDYVNGEKTSDTTEFIKKLEYVRPNEKLLLTSDGVDYEIITIEHPNDPKKPFVGINNIRNEFEFDNESFRAPFIWIYGLFKWLFILNLLVGLFNLLPLGIVDGGRMLYVLLGKIVKNKERANKIWSFISFLLLGIILLSILAHYFKQWGLF